VYAFEKAGFWIARQGKPVVMTNGQLILTIPCHNPVNAFTMSGIVRAAGLTIEQFHELLQVRRPANHGVQRTRIIRLALPRRDLIVE